MNELSSEDEHEDNYYEEKCGGGAQDQDCHAVLGDCLVSVGFFFKLDFLAFFQFLERGHVEFSMRL